MNTESGLSAAVTLSVSSPIALFHPHLFWWVLGGIGALWVGALFTVIGLATSGWASGSVAGVPDWHLGMWNFCVGSDICASLDSIIGSLPGSLISSRAFGVMSVMACGISILLWVGLVGTHAFYAATRENNTDQVIQVLRRKRRLLLWASIGHWVSAALAIITLLTMRSFLTTYGFLSAGHYSWGFALWILGMITQAVLPCGLALAKI